MHIFSSYGCALHFGVVQNARHCQRRVFNFPIQPNGIPFRARFIFIQVNCIMLSNLFPSSESTRQMFWEICKSKSPLAAAIIASELEIVHVSTLCAICVTLPGASFVSGWSFKYSLSKSHLTCRMEESSTFLLVLWRGVFSRHAM